MENILVRDSYKKRNFTDLWDATATLSGTYNSGYFKVDKREYSYSLDKIVYDTKIKSIQNYISWNTCDYNTSTDYNSLFVSGKLYATTAATATWGDWGHEWVVAPMPLSPGQRIRQIIRDRQAPLILTRNRRPMRVECDAREVRARETLRRVLGDAKFQTFLRNGFVTVRAKSGLVYQIFPGHGITSVYKQGKMVDRLCVVLTSGFPPTDSIIMRYLLVLNDEAEFRKLSIKHSVIGKDSAVPSEPIRSLVEIFGELKAAA